MADLAYGTGRGGWITDAGRVGAAEAEGFIASVHGAMLSRRAYGDPAVFELVAGALLERMAAEGD